MGWIKPKIWDLGIFSTLSPFFWMAKNQIHIDIAFDGYS